MAIISDIWDNEFDTDAGFSQMPVDKTSDSYRFRTVLTEKEISTGTIAFTLKNYGDEKVRGLLLRRRRDLGLEEFPQQLVKIQSTAVEVLLKKTSASEIKLVLGEYLQEIEPKPGDVMVLEVFVGKRGARDLQIHILPDTKADLDHQFRFLQRAIAEEGPVSTYWYFAEDFITALIRETLPSIKNQRPEQQIGGIEVRRLGENFASPTWVQWVWENERELTILVPDAASVNSMLASAIEVEYRLAGFWHDAHARVWALSIPLEQVPFQAAKKILHVLREIFKVSVAGTWRFSPYEAASDLMIRQHIRYWMAEGPSAVEMQSEMIRELFEVGFQLPGPLLVPRWIEPFLVE